MSDRTAIFELWKIDEATESCSASFDVSHGQVVMRTSSRTFGDKSYAGRDAFDALELFRRDIEPLGWRVLLNGARKDTYPSGMARDMGRGFFVYAIPPEGPPIQAFEAASPDQVGTVDEQLENWLAWVDQVKAARSQ